MGGQVLEREREVSVLAAAARDAAGGAGSVVLVYGEAGIGKSTLVTAVWPGLPAEGRMLVGHCDDLSTPRTLGPFRDLVGSVGPRLSAVLPRDAAHDAVLTELRAELDRGGRPTVLVVEDVHWADDATLDALRFLVRRIDAIPAVLVLTYREEELTPEHPFQLLLGDVAAAKRVHRLPLPRLSAAAVEQLSAGRDVEPAHVFEVTAGNPFFVQEVLAAGGDHPVPATVVDAVRARVRRLDTRSQEVMEQLAVIPAVADRSLVDTLVPGADAELAAAESHGLLSVTPRSVAFRHELTRRAVVDSLPSARRIELNRRVLGTLARDPAADLARLMHHAAGAGEADAVVRYGPAAARDAIGAGAHRQAVEHLAATLEHRDRLPPTERADLLQLYSAECYTVGDVQATVEAQLDAVRLRRTLGDPRELGDALRWLSRVHWWSGDRPAAEQAAVEAIAVLEVVGDDRLLALALSNQSQLHALANRSDPSIELGRRAVALAREAGDAVTVSHALTNVGIALWDQGDPEGLPTMDEALRVALTAGETEPAARAYVNISSSLLDFFRVTEAERYLTDGLARCEGTQRMTARNFLALEHARLSLAKGAWDEAAGEVEFAIGSPQAPIRLRALIVLARSRLRRGAPEAMTLLADAWETAEQLLELQGTAPVAAAMAEAAWLRGDTAAVVGHARPAFDEARRRQVRAWEAELGYWLEKAGQAVEHSAGDHPYALLTSGRWRDAAAVWEREGCPYERALALAESPDPDDLLTALTGLNDIGAVPLAGVVRARLRSLGVTHLPRGPLPSTRSNPGGLTHRQLEVMRLIATGETNREIADRLVLSERTVDTHVAAIFAKLGAHTRREASDRAADLGLLDAPI
ncbi:MAG: ATP-binding protein [Nocardioidaceae bacterium]